MSTVTNPFVRKTNTCVKTYEKLWSQLENMLFYFRKNKTLLKINNCELYFTFSNADTYGGCGKCNTRYKHIDVSGYVKGSQFETNEYYHFSGSINQYYLHDCVESVSTIRLDIKNDRRKLLRNLQKRFDEYGVFLNCHIEDTQFCVFQYFVDFKYLIEKYIN